MDDDPRPIPVDRFRGALLAAACGDALGAAYEGSSFEEGAPTELEPVAEGRLRWTDDTHMMLTLGRSLLREEGVDGARLAEAFRRAHEEEPWRGYGPGPPRIFRMLREGVSWRVAPRRLFGGKGSFGNGGAMRVAPVALWAPRDLDRVDDLARKSAAVTHAHPLGGEGAALQACAVALSLTSGDGVEREAFLEPLAGRARDPVFRDALEALGEMTARTPAAEIVGRLGHGVEAHRSVPTALACFLRSPDDLGETIRFAVSLGGDTDTIACMAGALAGARLGEGAVAEAWLERLEAADEIRELADRLHARASGEAMG